LAFRKRDNMDMRSIYNYAGRIGDLWYLIIFAILIIWGFILPDFFLRLLNEMMIMALFAMAVNLLLGYTGMISFGHAAYFGIGVYSCALLVTKVDLPLNIVFPISFLVAAILSSLAGLIFGFFAIRARGIYFALLTLAFGQLIWAILYQWYNFTGGDTGISKVYPPTEFLKSPEGYYFFTLIIVGICFFALFRIDRSPFGWALRAIRENPTRTEFIGIGVATYRLAVFVISTFFSGIAGALFAYFLRYAHPSHAGFLKSGEPLLACLVGGIYQFMGPALGTLIMMLLDWLTNRITEYWPLVMGIILALVVLFFPTGICGFISERAKKGQ
jgi:branched-chain amino acid transport system permease protein